VFEVDLGIGIGMIGIEGKEVGYQVMEVRNLFFLYSLMDLGIIDRLDHLYLLEM
jgi:hypothetical protein